MRKILLILLLIAAFVVMFLYLDPAKEWIKGLGVWGPLALGGLYVLTCVAFVPGTILTLVAGASFGVVLGSVTVSIASTLGATLAFLVGRYLARERIARLVAGNPRFLAVDEAVGRQGLKIVLLTRLSPVFPFNLLNFSYGLTRVRLRDYALGSWVGMMPGTVMFVYVGAVFGEAATDRTRTPAEWALFGGGLIATVAVAVFVARIAKRAIDEATLPEVREVGHDARQESRAREQDETST
ncbi:MAG: TVP38/TMEM64 family protein [Planctomycetota bacterium]|jgi:uncharacterized membrane protein YdjX (TVP38/TMEM64 family)